MLRKLYQRTFRTGRTLYTFQQYRTIQCCSKLQIKMYMEYENRFAYSIMENKGYAINFNSESRKENPCSEEKYSDIITKDWSKKSPKEIFDTFSILGTYCSHNNMAISDEKFDIFIDNLTDNIHNASDEQLRDLFYSILTWPETESIRTRNYIEVWAALDDECLKRLRDWSYDEILSFITMFFMINVTKYCEFTLKGLQKMASKSKQLTVGQYVQAMFYIGILRKSPFDAFNLELYLDTHFSEISIDELAIVSMGLFKSKTPVRSQELVKKIIYKVMQNSSNINEVSLAALLKIIRYSFRDYSSPIIYELLNTFKNEVPRLSNMCKVHLGLVGMCNLTLHKECLQIIAESTIETISMTRLKDLERLVLIYGTFNYKPTLNRNVCFFDKVLEELRRPERIPEIKNHGRSFACCVSFLSMLEYYPIDLMSKVLSPEFLLNTYGKHALTYGKEILSVHNTAKIFCPEADMNRLSDKQATILAKKYTDYVPDANQKKQFNVTDKMMLEISEILRESRGGDDFVISEHILTHHQKGDIIICNEVNGSPVEVKKHFIPSEFGLIRKPPDDNIWIVLVGGRNCLIFDSNSPTGPFLSKVRELEMLGFHAALIPWAEYIALDTKEAKTYYINSLISSAIQKRKTKQSVNI